MPSDRGLSGEKSDGVDEESEDRSRSKGFKLEIGLLIEMPKIKSYIIDDLILLDKESDCLVN